MMNWVSSAGLINRFRLSSALDLNVELRGLFDERRIWITQVLKDWLV